MNLTRVYERSACCNAKVKVVGQVTMCYVCLKCKQACNVLFRRRGKWTINPKTQIQKSKKIYKRARVKQQESKEK